MIRRECGCAWTIVPAPEVPGRLRLTGLPVAKFTQRCDEHSVMCRLLEQWEIELTQDRQVSSRKTPGGTQ